MDKFVIDKVVTVIHYQSIQFSNQARCSDCRRAPCKVPVLPPREASAVHINTGTALTTRLNVFGFVKPVPSAAEAERR